MNIEHVKVDNLYHMSKMIGIEGIGFNTLPPLEYDTVGWFFLSICIQYISMHGLHSQNLTKLNAIDIKYCGYG